MIKKGMHALGIICAALGLLGCIMWLSGCTLHLHIKEQHTHVRYGMSDAMDDTNMSAVIDVAKVILEASTEQKEGK